MSNRQASVDGTSHMYVQLIIDYFDGLGRRLFSCLHQVLRNPFVQFGSLPGFVGFSAPQNPANDLASVDMLEGMLRDFTEDAHFLGCLVWVIRQRNEGGRAMIDNVGRSRWQGLEVWLARGEGSGEDDGMDILGDSQAQNFNLQGQVSDVPDTGAHKDHVRKCS